MYKFNTPVKMIEHVIQVGKFDLINIPDKLRSRLIANKVHSQNIGTFEGGAHKKLRKEIASICTEPRLTFQLLLNPNINMVCECGNISYKNGVIKRFCSRSCSNKSESTKTAYRETCLAKWGVDNASKVTEIKERKVSTCLANHGVSHPQQSKAVRKKTKSNFIKNYGAENPSQVKEFVDRREATMLERFGAKNIRQSDYMKEKLEDVKRNSYAYKEAKFRGRTLRVQGYEDRALAYLSKIGVRKLSNNPKDIPKVTYKDHGKLRRYFTDFIITYEGKTYLVEVKSTFTLGLVQDKDRYRNFCKKAKACKREGFSLMLLVLSSG